ncbi:TRAP transporter substrate-binding protein [Lentibacillus halophilus]|uniref:TRAP transporter substrate-binding protein n=1 Tax=Lentibacillus halophilus TaxID=295065 RepID=A0ABP3J5Q4_9BACI
MLKRYMLGLLAIGFMMALAACGSDESSGGGGSEGSGGSEGEGNGNSGGEEINIIAAHVVSPEATQQDMYEKFKELVEEKSDGRITMEIYPDGQLGGEREMVESTQAGDIQISSPSVGVLANFSSALEVFDFPFIFKDRETVYDVLDGEVGQQLLDGLEESGIKGLGYSENGWRHLNTTEEQVVKPEEMEGKKLRTMEVPMHIAFWEELGANPTPMAFTEVFNGLSQGVVDAQENPLQLTYTSNFYEPAPYITLTKHIFDPEIVIVNQEFFNSLSEKDQDIIQSSLDEAIAHLRDLNSDLDEELRTKLKDEGTKIRELSDEERQAWIDATLPFYKEYADEVNKDTLIDLLEAAGNDKILNAIQ